MSVERFETGEADQIQSSSFKERFLKSRETHKKKYFIGTCLVKFAALFAFGGITSKMISDFKDRPKYISVCLYVVSEELDLEVHYSNCTITLNQEEFTCSTEYGSFPEEPAENNTDVVSEYIDINHYSGYLNAEIRDSSYQTGFSENSEDNIRDPGYGDGFKGDSSSGSSYKWSRDVAEAIEEKSDSYGGISDLYSNSAKYYEMDSSGSRKKGFRSLETIEDGYEATDDANTARDFANSVSDDLIVFLFIIWCVANILFKLIRAFIIWPDIMEHPELSVCGRFSFSIFENIIEVFLSSALYPVFLPKYGDCLECPIQFMCDPVFYGFCVAGFFISMIIILLSMCECGRKLVSMFWKCMIENDGRPDYQLDESTKNRRAVKGLICCLMIIAVIIYIIASIAIVIITFIGNLKSLIYPGVQLSISIIYYSVLISNKATGDIQHSLNHV